MPRTIEQSVRLPAPAGELFDTYLDPERHAAITGNPVTIAPEPGANFSAFAGALSGKVLLVQPKRLIVQTWRANHWKEEDIDSVLVLTFHPDPAGGRIDLVHVNVADHDFDEVTHGWAKYYWGPWRKYLAGR